MLEDDGTVPLQWLPRPPLGWSRTPGSPQDSPQPLYGVCGETQEPCIKQRREAMCQPGESLGGPRAAGEEPQEGSALAPSSPS